MCGQVNLTAIGMEAEGSGMSRVARVKYAYVKHNRYCGVRVSDETDRY